MSSPLDHRFLKVVFWSLDIVWDLALRIVDFSLHCISSSKMYYVEIVYNHSRCFFIQMFYKFERLQRLFYTGFNEVG